MHIVTLKKGLTVPQALEDSEGIAALGFFINVCPTNDRVTDMLGFSRNIKY